jgi:excisionase family DNA binding protein
MSDDRLLSPDEVAEVLGVSRLTVVRWVRAGKLKGQKLGKKTIRVKASDMEAFINQPPSLTLLEGGAQAAHLSDGDKPQEDPPQ